ncbi:hypothetical protein J2X20_004746 [Pelomonas saccharophila]|uniref:Uncharacterized protein n=1 Tax=Roseateles saccharophilus TaxID=304 RepID=A0ABU1YT83_ROSSA|nr:hypothetical protein [Roseateles saccharophilus]MDR7272072.1 hypothetical protein [Roseateles saccharophilus]
MAVAFWIGVVQQKEQDLGKATDLFFKGAAPFIAFAYFIYQILGGTFFATTAVVLSAERSKDNPRALVVKLSIERGSQWVAEIVSDELFFHRKPDVWDEKPMSRKVGLMPRRRDGLLRMAAGEKSSTEIRLKVPAGSFFITARIVSRAIYWPTPSESFARVCVPAIAEQQAS